MMISIEQVERLREKTGVSYQDARDALEKTDGDILDAVIFLEREGKLSPPEGGGRARVEPKPKADEEEPRPKSKKAESHTFGEAADKFLSFCGKIIHAGSVNSFVVTKKDNNVLDIPVTLLVLLLILPTSPFVIAALIIGLFCDYRYSFRGPNLGKKNVNDAIGSVANTVDEIKKNMKNSEEKE